MCNTLYNSHIVQSDNTDTGKERYFLIFGPLDLHDTVCIVSQQTLCIRTVVTVYLQAFARGHKTKYIIARYRLTTSRQFVQDLIRTLSEDHQFRTFL
ncbi:hypothetical protein D3C72_2268690 [compost metagenome]